MNLYLNLIKIGCLGFGGGSALIPIMKKELAQKNNYVSQDEFDEIVAVASVTPGALPVEIASMVGKKVNGIPGMILGACSMAIPGIILAIIMFALFCIENMYVAKVLKIVALFITTFVVYLLTKYIKNVVSKNNKTIIAVIIFVALLSCGKNLVKILGINVDTYINLSSIKILLLSFFILAYLGDKRNWYKKFIAIALIALYVISDTFGFLYSEYLEIFAIIAMIVCALISMKRDLKNVKKIEKTTVENILKEAIAWIIFLIIFSLPMIILMKDYIVLIGRALLSSFISFGGGDAYLTVAEGMFVSTGYIASADFYGKIVPAVNAVPGSILCKTLSVIGVCLGVCTNGSILKGIIFGLAFMAVSIMGSGIVVSLTHNLCDSIREMNFFKQIKKWIMIIVSGLLINIILSLIQQNMTIVEETIEINRWWGIPITLIIFLIICIINKKSSKNCSK